MSVLTELDLRATVAERIEEADGIVSVVLTPPAGSRLPEWAPGAHVDLELPGGLVRQYSLSGDPADGSGYTITVLDEPGGRGGSRAVHDLSLGSTVRLRGVRNHFVLTEEPSYVFVAGGIGITPLRPMIEEVERLGLPWELHYAGRSRASMAFVDRLVAEHPSRVAVYARDEGGSLDLAAVVAASSGAALYCCGPGRMIDAAETLCRNAGRELHLERFAAGDGVEVFSADDQPFEVHLAQSGITIVVEPGQTILDVAEAAGADVFGSCLEGICGTCETRVLDGVPDHRDSVLNGEETGTMMICVSRAACPRLTLDA
ncbi:PDR/VanB family oxidoreductase [Herbiconiux moechotypicola]|uniref:PDR/VanB family oxidoreductase n=1 Tax=Herbiconiux moechotypicola TaxID=637393 RepID=A0ABN3DEP4_9MICO|nr:PDR/VanB family oxidoreductase [Herbiconiux moechotypicola]MCS5729338.1 PDR/VanB family oxidoreductase [Herbiconiux moechotypicola]